MTLRDKISDDTKSAMKSKDKVKVSTLRLVSAAIKDRDIAARNSDRCNGVDDTEIMSLLVKMLKQREESVKTYAENGRPELAEREQTEIDIIKEYMPTPLTDTEVEEAISKIIDRSGATGLKDMGKIMNALKADYAGRIDMGKAGKLVKSKLTS